MSRKIIIPALTALLGLLVGGGSNEYILHRHDLRTKEAFVQREKCKNLADRYIRENSNDDTSLILEKTDFSAAHNSCYAAVNSFTTYGVVTEEGWDLVDLLSGEVTNIGTCNTQRDCGNGRNINYLERRDVLFDSAIDGTNPPKETSKR